jgi:hypothetical protein
VIVISNVKLNELFKVVIEPDNSKSILLDLQSKYKIDTLYFLQLCKEGIPLPIPQDDFNYWLYQYKIFVAAEGDVSELIVGFQKNEGSDCTLDPFDEFNSPFFMGQAIEDIFIEDVKIEEAIASSIFIPCLAIPTGRLPNRNGS